jgi:hypothetical protein
MSLTLADLGVMVAILAALNVPFMLIVRVSMASSYIPREALEMRFAGEAVARELQVADTSRQLKLISEALLELKAEIRRVQSPPQVDKLQALLTRVDAQDRDRVASIARQDQRLAHIESLLVERTAE